MSQEMSYAQALNEARQLIVQQQYRIKSDADKIRTQQQTIVDQSTSITDSERKIKEMTSEITRLCEEIRTHGHSLAETTIAKQQAEAVVDSQGQRMTALQSTLSEMEKKISDHAAKISDLEAERNGLSSRLPSPEDAEALNQMRDLLSRRPESLKRSTTGPTMRLAEVISESDDSASSTSMSQAQAA